MSTAHVRQRLRAVDDGGDAALARFAADRRDGIDVPSTFETCATPSSFTSGVIAAYSASRSSEPSGDAGPPTLIVAPVRSQTSCHGTMLAWCSMRVSRIDVARPSGAASAHEYATRLIAKVVPLVSTRSSPRDVEDAAPGLRARGFVGFRRLAAERVHRAADVGVVAAIERVDRLDHRRRLLPGVRRIEIDQRLAVHLAAQAAGSPRGRGPSRRRRSVRRCSCGALQGGAGRDRARLPRTAAAFRRARTTRRGRTRR